MKITDFPQVLTCPFVLGDSFRPTGLCLATLAFKKLRVNLIHPQ